jgi:hypothetical protein
MVRPVVFLIFLLASLWRPALAQDSGAKFTRFAGFHLGTVTLSDVQKKLGKAKLIETGEAGEYEAAICYRTYLGLVYFLSGEMGGSELDLLAFGISGSDKTKPCSPFPKKWPSSRLELAGLRLGMTKAQFERVVATKVEWNGDIGRAFYQSKLPMTSAEIDVQPKNVRRMIASGEQQDYFDVLVSVVGTFAEGKLIDFRVWKIESL